MSEAKLYDWVAEFDVDYDTRTFVVSRVVNVDGKEYPPHRRPHTFVSAGDELGAFHAGNKIMRRLGFNPK